MISILANFSWNSPVLSLADEYLEWLDTLEEDHRPVNFAWSNEFGAYSVVFRSKDAATLFKLRWL